MKRLLAISLFLLSILCCNTCFAQDDAYGTHFVQAGETLYSIAKKYFITVADIQEANTEIKDNNIKSGEIIRIPKTARNHSLFSTSTYEVDEQAIFSSKEKSPSKSSATKSQKNHFKVAMLLPLFYDNIDELSFNQYNIEEKKIANIRNPYKCFSYISFYEGARIALDKLEKQGYKVSLYVFDVGEDDTQKMAKTLEYPTMKEMDLIVPLVFKNSFSMVSSFAQKNSIPVVNPMSSADNILTSEYIFKIQPNDISEAKTVLTYIAEKQKGSQVIVLFDDSNTPSYLLNWYKNNITTYLPDGSWTMLNYRKSANKLKSYLKSDKRNIIVNIIKNNTGDFNKTHAKKLSQSLAEMASSYKISLFAQYDWLNYGNVDYSTMDKLDFHFTLTYYNDYTNPNFVNFVKEYRKNFKTEPDKIYAALGYDIFMYFLTAMKERGENFMLTPNTKNTNGMINHFRFKKSENNLGWQNETTTIYKLSNYKIQSEWSY